MRIEIQIVAVGGRKGLDDLVVDVLEMADQTKLGDEIAIGDPGHGPGYLKGSGGDGAPDRWDMLARSPERIRRP